MVATVSACISAPNSAWITLPDHRSPSGQVDCFVAADAVVVAAAAAQPVRLSLRERLDDLPSGFAAVSTACPVPAAYGAQLVHSLFSHAWLWAKAWVRLEEPDCQEGPHREMQPSRQVQCLSEEEKEEETPWRGLCWYRCFRATL